MEGKLYDMQEQKSMWSAAFVCYQDLEGKFPYRRMHFKDLTNEYAVITKPKFFIDETPNLKAIGNLTTGEIVSFLADQDFNKIKFCYPHGEREK